MEAEIFTIPAEIDLSEAGDLLPAEVRVISSEVASSKRGESLCDGEGGRAPSMGTRAA